MNRWGKRIEKDGKYVQSTRRLRTTNLLLFCQRYTEFSSKCLLALVLLLVMCFVEEERTLFYTERNTIHAYSSQNVMSC